MGFQMSKKLLLIESGHYGEDIKTLSLSGYDVIFITTGVIPVDEKNLLTSLEYYIDKDFVYYDLLLSKVKEILVIYPDIQCIFTTSDFFVSNVSKICESLGFKYLSFSSATLFANKHQFRLQQRALGYLFPEFEVFSDYKEGYGYIKNNPDKLPLVFKPICGNESIGVKLIHSAEDLKVSCKELVLFSKFSKNMISKEYLLEEYIEGEVVSCEFIKTNNELFLLGITDRIMSNPPYFIELGYSFPCEHKDKDALYEETRNIIQDFHYDFGPGHIEFIITPKNEIYILEVNARLVGWPISKMISDSIQKNIFIILAELYEKGTVTLENIIYLTCTCLEVTSDKSGRLIDYYIPEEVDKDPNVTFYFFKNKGDMVRTPKSNTDLVMRFIVKAPSYDTSVTKAKKIIKTIQLKIENN